MKLGLSMCWAVLLLGCANSGGDPFAGGSEAQGQSVSIATGPTGSLTNETGAAVVKVLDGGASKSNGASPSSNSGSGASKSTSTSGAGPSDNSGNSANKSTSTSGASPSNNSGGGASKSASTSGADPSNNSGGGATKSASTSGASPSSNSGSGSTKSTGTSGAGPSSNSGDSATKSASTSGASQPNDSGGGSNGVVVPHTPNSQDQAKVLGKDVQFGIYTTQEMDAAVKGDNQFKGHAQPDLRVAARLLPVTVAVLARDPSTKQPQPTTKKAAAKQRSTKRKVATIRKMSDLKGKRFPTGYTEQKTLALLVNAVLANAELSTSDIKGVHVQNDKGATDLFLKGQLDALVWTLGGDSLKTIDGKAGGIRILALTDTPEAAARMESDYPLSYLFELQPSKATPGITAPTWVMAYDIVLVTSASTSEDVVYNAVKALHDGKAALVKESALFKGFNPAKMGQAYPGQLYHPGAIKFYKEAGIWSGG